MLNSWLRKRTRRASREEFVQEVALADEKVKAEIDGKDIVKVISVPLASLLISLLNNEFISPICHLQ